MSLLGLISIAWLSMIGGIWYFYNWKVMIVTGVLSILMLMYPKAPNKVIMMAVLLVAISTVWYWYGFGVILLGGLWVALSLLYKRIDKGPSSYAHRI